MNETADNELETPTGKGTADENFPVGSFLLSPYRRRHVALFYSLARAMDDISDNGDLLPEDKLARLDRFEKALTGKVLGDPALTKAYAVARSSTQTGVTLRHSVDLIKAFKQDAVKRRYVDWGDLMGYCNLSASPVGRFILDLHGEETSNYLASDALCNTLQVLNHLQDLKDDCRALDRVYLPGSWMAAQGVSVEDLKGDSASPGLRAVIDLCLDQCDLLLIDARRLLSELESRRLRMEVSVIIRLADRLIARLRMNDPIARRVALTKTDFLLCGISGVVATLFRT